MKKIAFFCCALLALGFASCDDKSDLGTIQTNPQLPGVEASDLNPETSAELQKSAIDLNAFSEIPAISTPEVENLPAGASVAYEMHVATKADFSDATVIPVENGKVSADAWNEYFRENLGMSNMAEPNYIRFAAYFVQGTQRYRAGDVNTWYASKSIKVTPKSFTYDMATVRTDLGNYQLANFAQDGTAYTGVMQLTSEYTFTINGKTYGRKNASTLEEGTTPCTVRKAGVYVVEFNSEALTYKATEIKTFGAIGDFNKRARQVNLTREDGKLIYKGDVDFGDNAGTFFKFRCSNNNNYQFGGYRTDLILGGQDLEVPGAGVYTLTVDLSKIPYSYTFVKK